MPEKQRPEVAKAGEGTFCEYTLGELFCGPGGLGLGAAFAGVSRGSETWRIKHLWAIDNHRDSCDTYERNLKPGKVVCSDIRAVDFSGLPGPDILSFGFPCNDFSVVGERKGFEGSFGPLYRHAVRAVDEFKPLCFVAENVKGLVSHDKGRTFKRIMADFEEAGDGYRICAHLYRFEDYGIPQSRHRIVMVGIAKGLNRSFCPPSIKEFRRVTAREALECPPIPEWAENHEITKQAKLATERLKLIKPGQNAWNADLPDWAKLNVAKARLSHIYRRLHPDRPSYTITGSGGGGTHVYHWEEPRALTNRERARLQTFPDDFAFCGSKESVRKQIGMAVPPQFGKIVFDALIKTLNGIPFESVLSPSSIKFPTLPLNFDFDLPIRNAE